MRMWIFLAAAAATPSAVAAESYSQPVCIKKTSMISGSASEWVTISQNFQRATVYVKAYMYTPDTNEPPQGVLHILVNQAEVQGPNLKDLKTNSSPTVAVGAPVVLEPEKEYRISAHVDNPDTVHPPVVLMRIDIGGGCD